MEEFINQTNLFSAYKKVVLTCGISILLMAVLTVYILYFSFQYYAAHTQNAFVFSKKGASVHVFVNKND